MGPGLGAAWGRLGGVMEPLGAPRGRPEGRFWGSLSDVVLGAVSEPISEPFWSHFGCKTLRTAARSSMGKPLAALQNSGSASMRWAGHWRAAPLRYKLFFYFSFFVSSYCVVYFSSCGCRLVVALLLLLLHLFLSFQELGLTRRYRKRYIEHFPHRRETFRKVLFPAM